MAENNSLVLQQLNVSLNTEAKIIEYTPPPKKKKWWQILLNVLLGIITIPIEMAATAFLGPVGGMLVSVAADVTTNILGDVVNGNNPWDLQNIIFNIVTPIASVVPKTFNLSKLAKSPLRKMGEFYQNKKLNNLAVKFNNGLLNSKDIDYSKLGKRKYDELLKDVSLDDLKDLKQFTTKGFSHWHENYKLKYKKIEKFNTYLRKAQKGLSYISDPNLASKTLFSWIVKKTPIYDVIKNVNKKLKFFKKKIYSKFFKNQEKRLKKLIIPLNHTKAPWILGVKLFNVRGTMNYFHMSIYFDKKITNNKAPVILYNKSWRVVYAFLTTPSAGKYYIDNFSFGWQLGKILKNGKLIVNSFKLAPFLSQYYQTFYLSMNLIRKTTNIVDAVLTGDIVQKWKESFNLQNTISNITFGVSEHLKVGGTTVRAIVKSIQYQKPIYLSKHLKNRTRQFITKKTKDIWKDVTHGNKKYIGYGKYRYPIYKIKAK